MEIRYLGFEQRQNARTFQFDVREKGQPTRQLTVTANMDIFRDHHVAIQEGPTLSGNKLTSDLERGWEGEHELTTVDLRAYAASRSLAEAQRAEMRAGTRRRPAPSPEAQEKTPWRHFGI